MEPKGRLTTVGDIKEFTLAGNARITLVGKECRFTYRIRVCEDNQNLWFVQLLTGPDNCSDYKYLGTIRSFPSSKSGQWQHGIKSSVIPTAKSVLAFGYFYRHVWLGGAIPEPLEVWHEGYCGRCGRALTVPESVARGFGPECASIMGEVS